MHEISALDRGDTIEKWKECYTCWKHSWPQYENADALVADIENAVNVPVSTMKALGMGSQATSMMTYVAGFEPNQEAQVTRNLPMHYNDQSVPLLQTIFKKQFNNYLESEAWISFFTAGTTGDVSNDPMTFWKVKSC